LAVKLLKDKDEYMNRLPHVLDRPIWHALRTHHAAHLQGGNLAVRYAPDVTPFAATIDESDAALRELAKLTSADAITILLQASPTPAPPGTIVEATSAAVQLMAANIDRKLLPGDVVELGENDAPAMRALAALTKPGPFLPRTHRLGGFVGVKHNGQLVAMAGERMKLTGYTEVSGVCTHPDFRGKSYGRLLSQLVAQRIVDRGEIPFLHAYAANTKAIQLYESIGFAKRSEMNVTVLRRAAQN
jgi:predicted GNAT family acetyltransferase